MHPDWKPVALRDLVEPGRTISYGIVQPGAPVADGVPIVRVGDVREGRIASAAPLRVSSSVEAAYSRTRLRGGELLLTLVGTVGETAVVPPTLAGWNTARAIAVIPIRRDVGADWVQWALRTRAVRDRISARLNTTVQATLNLRDVAELPIILPSKPERDAIGNILGALQAKVELNRRMAETLEAMARALFRSWFVDFDATGGVMPDDWSVEPISTVADVVGGGTPRTSEAAYWGGNIPWFSVVDAPALSEVWVLETEKTITPEGVAHSATRVLPVGTTILSARGTVGKVALVGVPMTMNQSCYGLRPRAERTAAFVYYCTRNAVASLQQRAHGSVFDTITRDTLTATRLPVPPVATMQAFEDRAMPLLERIRVGLEESRTLAALRDALLPKLLSGELPVPDLERLGTVPRDV